MSITIGSILFDGPFKSAEDLEDRSGVYVILCKENDNNYKVIDVGESAKVKSRVESHDRKPCWESNCNSSLAVAVHYTPRLQQSGRMEIEQALRSEFNPPCGER